MQSDPGRLHGPTPGTDSASKLWGWGGVRSWWAINASLAEAQRII